MHLQQSEISTDSKVIHYLKYLHICFNMPMHLYVTRLHKMPLYLVLYLFFLIWVSWSLLLKITL